MDAALDFLTAAQNDDGGWGYRGGQTSACEPTAAAALALHGDPARADRLSAALGWLNAAQHADGGWGMSAADTESGWPTAWAVLALAAADQSAAARRGAIWLGGVSVPLVTDDELQDEMRRKLSVDPTLNGWPWWPGEAGWVEPTALTLLALAAVGATDVAARVAEAARYLADRRCRGGGWNFGNPVMLGGYLPARAHPTAWTLLALRRVAPELIQPGDLVFLRAEARRDGGASALALACLALRAQGEDDAELTARLAARQGRDGGWDGNPYHTALAVLAGRKDPKGLADL